MPREPRDPLRRYFNLLIIGIVLTLFIGAATYATSQAQVNRDLARIENNCPPRPTTDDKRWRDLCHNHGADGRDCDMLLGYWWQDRRDDIDPAFAHPLHCP